MTGRFEVGFQQALFVINLTGRWCVSSVENSRLWRFREKILHLYSKFKRQDCVPQWHARKLRIKAKVAKHSGDFFTKVNLSSPVLFKQWSTTGKIIACNLATETHYKMTELSFKFYTFLDSAGWPLLFVIFNMQLENVCTGSFNWIQEKGLNGSHLRVSSSNMNDDFWQ